MKVYLNAGFGEPLPQADFEQLKRLGFAGIRTDILDNGLADACAAEVKSAGVEAIFLVKSDQIHCSRRNPRLIRQRVVARSRTSQTTPLSLETLAANHAAAAANPDIQFVSGGVAFWESGGRDYLGRMIAAGLADSVIIGFHAYRTTPATTPLPGFASRAAEFAELRRIAPGRRYWHTEVGWHTARRCTLQIGPFCFRSEQLSDTQVRDYWADELQINQDNGVRWWSATSDNDGPSTAADRFGFAGWMAARSRLQRCLRLMPRQLQSPFLHQRHGRASLDRHDRLPAATTPDGRRA